MDIILIALININLWATLTSHILNKNKIYIKNLLNLGQFLEMDNKNILNNYKKVILNERIVVSYKIKNIEDSFVNNLEK